MVKKPETPKKKPTKGVKRATSKSRVSAKGAKGTKSKPKTNAKRQTVSRKKPTSTSKTSKSHSVSQDNQAAKKPLIKRILYYGMAAGIWGLIAMIILFAFLARGLPDLDNLPAPGAQEPAIIVKASNGATIARTGPVYGDWLDVDALPDSMVRALLSVEDKNFFSHPGIDGKGLLRAVVVNLQAGRVRSGGSTITQQLAKNMFLTSRRTMTRKAQELLLTFWLEQKFTKKQILSLYLNRVYFGGGAYGIDAASRKYYGHPASTLSIPEAALLAGLVKAPSSLAPHINPEGAWTRAKIVMSTMINTGALTPEAAKQLSNKAPDIIHNQLGIDIRYFTDWISSSAHKLSDIKGRSVVIYTTLDPASQRAAADALKAGLNGEGRERQASQGAIVALDHDGAVKAMVGGSSYRNTQYNRATQALRQPGSAFKLFSYIAALESGVKITSKRVDEAIDVDGYAPKNYNGKFNGSMTVRDAFARSINTIAVKLAEDAGREKVVEVAKRLGITSRVMPIASLPLGTEEVRMIDLAAAYAAVANGGHLAKPYSIVEIATLDGEILYRHHARPPLPVLAYPVVRDMVDMLSAVIERGSGRNARIDRPAAGKSGTSQDSRDAVFAGFTSDITAVVWVGNDDGKPMKLVTGGGLPARIWKNFMISAHAGMPVRHLLADSAIYQQSAQSEADVKALREQQAKAEKEAAKTKDKKKKKKRGFFERLFGKKDKNN